MFLLQWSLVCDTAWIPATMSTIQIGFQLLGNFISGHIAEAVGRKVPIYLSLILLILFNLLSYFSVSWVMYAILRAFMGVSMGLFLTVRYNYMSEFSLSRWRTWLIAFPSWSTQACLIAPVLWWLKDWRNAHLATSLIGIPFLVTWW